MNERKRHVVQRLRDELGRGVPSRLSVPCTQELPTNTPVVIANPLLLPHPSSSRSGHDGETRSIQMHGCKTGVVVSTHYSPETSL